MMPSTVVLIQHTITLLKELKEMRGNNQKEIDRR